MRVHLPFGLSAFLTPSRRCSVPRRSTSGDRRASYRPSCPALQTAALRPARAGITGAAPGAKRARKARARSAPGRQLVAGLVEPDLLAAGPLLQVLVPDAKARLVERAKVHAGD